MVDLTSLQKNAAELVSHAQKAGADACDVVVASGESLTVGIRDGQVENSKRAENNSVSLRVFCGKKIASVTSNTAADPEKLAERAVAMAKVSPEDQSQGLADADHLYATDGLTKTISQLDLLDETEPDAAAMETAALEAEQAGLQETGVTKSMGAGAGWTRSGFVLATSHGFSGSYERSGFSVQASMIAGEGTGMERDYDYDSATYLSDLDRAAAIGRSAGERAVKRLNPRQVKSGSYPIVCDPRISAGILGSLTSAINGAAVVRKTSFLRDKMGELVANARINIIDDPHMARRAGSKPFDGEGVATHRQVLVENGVLKTWLLDSATARELGLSTNGCAGRGGAGTSPTTSNCFMEAGEQSPEEMIAGIEDGLYLTETIGHGTNMVTGDYSKGAAGFWIKNGEITHPVAEITVAGNLCDMYLNMTPANDLKFKYGTNCPTLLIEGMTVGGN